MLNMNFSVTLPEKREKVFIQNIKPKKLSKGFKDEVKKEDAQIKKNQNIIEIPSDAFDLSRRVPDCAKFIISNNEVLEVNKPLTEETIRDYKNKKKIIIILESPHREELASQMYPAKGRTGKNIKNFLQAYLQLNQWSNLDQKELDIIVMNRIPYQTSLGDYYKGKLDKYIRSTIFLAIWKKKSIKKDFCDRLSKYANDDDLIINACTKLFTEKNNEETDAREFSKFVQNNFKNKYINLSHPVQWNIHNYDY